MEAHVTITYPKGFITSKDQLTTTSGYDLGSFKEKLNWYKEIATRILQVSQTLVPVVTGRLKKSGRIKQNSDGTYRIEYKEPYAVFVHEILGNRHTQPTQAKFLEDAGYLVLAELSIQTGDLKPLFTFHLEMGTDIGVIMYLDSVSTDKFLGWVKETRAEATMESI